MDHRGTGRSTLLQCSAMNAYSFLGSIIDFSEVAGCVQEVLTQIDGHTAAFSITSAAKDIHLLVSTLNANENVFIYGAGYGTYLAERVMHLAPVNVKGYALDGVVSERQGNFAHYFSNSEEAGLAKQLLE
ncbi:hypothetical protein Poli38472_001929 [Pythium oligandrum]|uniref:Uncharacterized protein n=1 Tax=Pythium oligandrum TaxID=41045 RepID=A0A8K1CWZ3_PYTOL|nr:hypothetical protein Poli38472_001929 [Pythium oligandrum]|eukprot:TMW69773.1 hypothetical protein Poli38472_001929 [Pythium oligandrum]